MTCYLLLQSGIELDRKSLQDLAIYEPRTFQVWILKGMCIINTLLCYYFTTIIVLILENSRRTEICTSEFGGAEIDPRRIHLSPFVSFRMVALLSGAKHRTSAVFRQKLVTLRTFSSVRRPISAERRRLSGA